MFVAQRESYEDTWINNYSPFVSEYAADASASLLTSQEVCCTIELRLLTGESDSACHCILKLMQSCFATAMFYTMHAAFFTKLYAAWCQTLPTETARCFVAVHCNGNSSSWKQARGIFLAKSTCVIPTHTSRLCITAG